MVEQAATRGAQAPPAGVTPNFDNPPGREVEIFVVASVCIAISTLFTALRSYTRFYLMKRRLLEDYILLLAWALAVFYFSMMPIGLKYKLGVHQWNVTIPELSTFLKATNTAEAIFSVASCAIKSAIIVQIFRIFAVTRQLYWPLIGLGVFNILFCFSIMMARIFECIPREKIWKPWTPGHCIDTGALVFTSAVGNAFIDFVLLLIPLVMTWRLQMRKADKVAVTIVFGAGAFACGASVMRAVEIAALRTGDFTYTVATIGLWCDAELATGVVCCCLPALPRLWRLRVAPRLSALKTRLFGVVTSAPSGVNGSYPKPPVLNDSEAELYRFREMAGTWESIGSESQLEDSARPGRRMGVTITTTFDMETIHTSKTASSR